MRISIFGLGYVGAVSYGGLTRLGHTVIGVDVDQNKLELFQNGQSPVIEAGMPELIGEAAQSGRARVTDDAVDAVLSSDISMVCVGTPSDFTGAHDLKALTHVCQQIGDALTQKTTPHIVVIRSTVAPGTTEQVIRPIFDSRGVIAPQLGICFQPEFLREGVSVEDFENPPMTIAGGDPSAVEAVKRVFKDVPGEFFSTSMKSAEMVKFCCNAFHAVKITFANEVGRLSKSLDVDSQKIMELLCQDTQLNISTAYLRPGFAFGGSCLPKDLRALVKLSQEGGVDMPMLSHVLASNEEHIKHATNLVLALESRSVAIVGISFKGGTDDLRESPLLELAERLIGKGFTVRIYDPEVNVSRLIGANKKYVEHAIPHIASIMDDDIEKMINAAEVVVLGVRDADAETYLTDSKNSHLRILDLVGVGDLAHHFSGTYISIC